MLFTFCLMGFYSLSASILFYLSFTFYSFKGFSFGLHFGEITDVFVTTEDIGPGARCRFVACDHQLWIYLSQLKFKTFFFSAELSFIVREKTQVRRHWNWVEVTWEDPKWLLRLHPHRHKIHPVLFMDILKMSPSWSINRFRHLLLDKSVMLIK